MKVLLVEKTKLDDAYIYITRIKAEYIKSKRTMNSSDCEHIREVPIRVERSVVQTRIFLI